MNALRNACHTPATRTSQLPPVMFMGDHFGYPGGVSHGLTTYFVEVFPALVRAGVDLTVCFLREPHPAAERLLELGVTPVFLSAAPSDPTVVMRVARLARERECGLVHAAGIKATLAARIVARRLGARALIHVHDRNRPTALVRSLHRAFSSRTDLGLCVASAVRDVAIEAYHVPPERVRVVPNSVALDRVRSVAPDARARLRQEFGIADAAPVASVVGRFYAVKGQRDLVEMLPEIVARVPDAVVVFVGDGPERPSCERRAAALGLGRHVRFLGQRADVAELLAMTDVVAVPSRSEGLPIVAIEALAAARPVVGFDVGGVREVVDDGVDGCVVPPRDRAAFVDALAALLLDTQRRHVFGARANAAAERFGIARHVGALLDCYGEAAAS